MVLKVGPKLITPLWSYVILVAKRPRLVNWISSWIRYLSQKMFCTLALWTTKITAAMGKRYPKKLRTGIISRNIINLIRLKILSSWPSHLILFHADQDGHGTRSYRSQPMRKVRGKLVTRWSAVRPSIKWSREVRLSVPRATHRSTVQRWSVLFLFVH